MENLKIEKSRDSERELCLHEFRAVVAEILSASVADFILATGNNQKTTV
jgi:hypothetical protein